MKITSLFILFLLPFLCLAQLSENAKDSNTQLAFANAQAKITLNNSALKNQIFEEKYVVINGIEQWVTIKGNSSKPIILFIHGGPGSPISPYIDVLYKDLEKDFIIVQWDQRGTGRTYGQNAPPEELTPEYFPFLSVPRFTWKTAKPSASKHPPTATKTFMSHRAH